ncbi:hypothetical protein KIW84_062562 [Lathyrus oleraceus]|uniref:Uncharacterized protein n=1 Tax=Pisum sativum TaxID=3888 RepID=A0A9D5A3Q5_PEA|nr:hypothetical protein KIW84_062562 [Pisum sativum]
MSQQYASTHMHVPAETSGSSFPTSRANELFQMINLANLVLDVAPLSTVHPPQNKKDTPYVSKNPNNNSSGKAEESVPEHVARERRSKKKVDLVVNVEELTSDEEPLTNIVTPSIAKRLQRRKGKTVVFEDSPSRLVNRKVGGLKGTPSKSSTGKSSVGPTRSCSKVVTPTRKRKVVSSSKSMFDVE